MKNNSKAKTKKNLIIAGTSLVCAALVCVTVSRFAAEQPMQTDRAYAETEPAEIVTTVVTTAAPDMKEPEITMTIKSEKAAETTAVSKTEIPAETKPMTEVDRSFEEITKPATEPPPPAVEDEAALTDPVAPPKYEPPQTTVTAAPEPQAENSFSARRYGGEDIKTLLGVYFEQNVTTEKFDNFDGERWILHEQ